MRIYLSGIEWLSQQPEGNRLRWWYPLDDASDGGYVGFPESLIVERAPVNEDIRPPEPGSALTFPAAGNIPFNWWDLIGDVTLFGFDLPSRHALHPAVQALRFTYRGPTTRLLLRDSAREITLLDIVASDGDDVAFEAADIDEVVVYSHAAQLEELTTLDMFKPRGLKWEQIAVIGVAPTLGAGLDEVLPRHEGISSLSKSEWDELVQMGQQAAASTPAAATPDDPTRWESFNLTVALRWELAALFGMGYYDGPHADVSPLDEINQSIELNSPGSTPLGYRVVDRGGTADPSNIIICPPWHAPPLAAPNTPQYMDPQVRLGSDGTFDATVEQRWHQNDPRAIGVVIEEEISGSAAIGSPPVTDTFEHRSRMETDEPSEAALARAFDVPFHDVTLTSRAVATDAWDRLSLPSPASPMTSLVLHHQPVPPGLLPGSYHSGSVRIPRQLGDEIVDDWTPDRIVEVAAGKVNLYRQVTQPRVETATANLPTMVKGDRHKVVITGISSLGDFEGGYLNANGVKYLIVDVNGNQLFFDAPGAGNSAVALFPAGSVELQQDDKDVALWTKVANFPAIGLPETLTFNDPVPEPANGTDVLSYVARVAYLGRLGPASNVSQVILIAPTPVVPPPFTVELLGVGFYDRTMVKIRLTSPSSNQRFSVWWADGTRSAADFANHAIAGEYVAQSAHDQRFLFDLLTLPVPQNQARDITIGLQAVNSGGGQSNFSVVPITVSAT